MWVGKLLCSRIRVLTPRTSTFGRLLRYRPFSPSMATSRQGTNVEKASGSNGNSPATDVENNAPRSNSVATARSYQATTRPFIGRLGGNQGFVLDRHNAANAEILKEQPDSAPCMTLGEQFDLRGFRNLGLWKAALIEGVGAFPPFPILVSKTIRMLILIFSM